MRGRGGDGTGVRLMLAEDAHPPPSPGARNRRPGPRPPRRSYPPATDARPEASTTSLAAAGRVRHRRAVRGAAVRATIPRASCSCSSTSAATTTGRCGTARSSNQTEYGEVVRFAKELTQGYEAREGPRRDLAGLRELEQLIGEARPPDQVWPATPEAAARRSRGALGGDARPPAPPNLARGRRLWISDCAPCHGPTGAGDGPASTGMDPPPTSFRGDFLERLTPRQVYNALTFGVDGTAMPSFADAYTAQQRWDVAFYCRRCGSTSSRSGRAKPVAVTLDELAVSSNTELLTRLRQTRPDATADEVDYLRVNLPVAGAAAAGGDPAPGGVAVALQLQDVFARRRRARLAARRRRRGYVRDPDWTPEALRAERGDAWIGRERGRAPLPRLPPGARRQRLPGRRRGLPPVLRPPDARRARRARPARRRRAAGPVAPAARVVGAEPTLDLAVLRVAEPRTARRRGHRSSSATATASSSATG